MTMQSHRAEELRDLSVLIFDEATLADVFVFEAIDHLLRDVTGIDRPFGGKVVLLGSFPTHLLKIRVCSGGDWKQLLPVTDVSADFSSDVCLMASPLWGMVKVGLSRTKR